MTPLQWAVLSAYARTLPPGPGRAALDEATAAGAPHPARQGVALTVARTAGLIERGRITDLGRLAARAYLPRLNLKAGG